MPIKIFKSLKNYLAPPLTKLVNLSIQNSVFPSILKSARLSPIFKKGDKTIPANYRPIASLPFISKIVERCVTNRLLSFYEKTNFLSNFQYGFRKGFSTVLPLIQLTENIFSSLNNKNHHISIFIDLTKAFDTVHHRILLDKLANSGVRGMALDWFASYLADREYCVGIGARSSTSRTINIGLPQGSILGPILFLVYVNELPNVSELLQPILFADDTTVSLSHQNFTHLVNNLNLELDKIYQWSISNRLSINAEKSELLLFTKRRVERDQCSVALGNNPLEIKSHCKFLGVILDENLQFSKHIEHVLVKLSKSSGILYRIRDSLPITARLNYYYAFIYPYLTYNVIVWGGSSAVHIKPIITQHKRIIRTICNSQRYDHSSPLFHQLNLLKFEDIYKFSLCVHMFKSLATGMFRVGHNRNTRQNNLAFSSFHRLTTCQKAFSFRGPQVWNNLPTDLRSIDSLPLFKKKLKEYFIGQYA